MNIDSLIRLLEQQREDHGNIRVVVYDQDDGAHNITIIEHDDELNEVTISTERF